MQPTHAEPRLRMGQKTIGRRISMAENFEYVLSMQNITKVYKDGFAANKNIDFSVRKGDIHGLVGENGAGKSTLMKVLFGQERPETGKIFFKGQEVAINNPMTALKLGIGMVHQHFTLVPSLTVAENMVFGVEPTKGIIFDHNEAVRRTNEVAQKFGLPVDPNMKVRDLYVGQKQRVEILKMLLRNIEVLILDEPTAVLTPQETEELFRQLINLKKHGYTIVFISHKLGEIKQICDRLTVLRDGRSIETVDVESVTEQDISRMMVGRNAVKTIEKEPVSPEEPRLQVSNLNYFNSFGKQVLDDVSFSVRAGEILGIAGIEGNGQREISEMIAGLEHIQSGEVLVDGASVKGKTVKEIREMSVSHISEDRMTYGAASEASIEDNLVSDRFYKKEFSKFSFLKKKTIRRVSDRLVGEFGIKCDGSEAKVRTLSGGNIQKVVAAREFSNNPRVLVANQPTRGIDVGASELIHKKLLELRSEKAAVLLISADITELMQMSDSLIVLCGGRIVAYFESLQNVTENELGEYMLGLKEQTREEIARCIR